MRNKTRPSILAVIHGHQSRLSIPAIIHGHQPRLSSTTINLGYQSRLSSTAIVVTTINRGYHPRPSISAITPGYHPRPSSSLPSTAAVIHGHRRHYRCNSQHAAICNTTTDTLIANAADGSIFTRAHSDNSAMGRFLRDTATMLTCCGPGVFR